MTTIRFVPPAMSRAASCSDYGSGDHHGCCGPCENQQELRLLSPSPRLISCRLSLTPLRHLLPSPRISCRLTSRFQTRRDMAPALPTVLSAGANGAFLYFFFRLLSIQAAPAATTTAATTTAAAAAATTTAVKGSITHTMHLSPSVTIPCLAQPNDAKSHQHARSRLLRAMVYKGTFGLHR